jgi:hypothetical protein
MGRVTIGLSLAILLAAVCSVTVSSVTVSSVIGGEQDIGREQATPSGKSGDDQTTKPAASKPADGKSSASAQKSARSKGKKIPGFTGEREAAAMTFVRTNHPELAELLDQLKTNDPDHYQRAIRDLFKSSERLAQLEERNPQRYPLELSMWKVDSRILVLLARLTMSPEPAVEDQLRQAVAEQFQLRKQLLAAEQQRVEQHLAELKADLDDLEQHEQEHIEQRMAKLLSQASRSQAKVKRSSPGKRVGNDQKADRE